MHLSSICVEMHLSFPWHHVKTAITQELNTAIIMQRGAMAFQYMYAHTCTNTYQWIPNETEKKVSPPHTEHINCRFWNVWTHEILYVADRSCSVYWHKVRTVWNPHNPKHLNWNRVKSFAEQNRHFWKLYLDSTWTCTSVHFDGAAAYPCWHWLRCGTHCVASSSQRWHTGNNIHTHIHSWVLLAWSRRPEHPGGTCTCIGGDWTSTQEGGLHWKPNLPAVRKQF